MRELKIGEALKILRKKRPELTGISLKQWIKEGLMKGRTEKHGIFEWHLIPESEVQRIFKLLPAGKRVIGKPLLERPKK